VASHFTGISDGLQEYLVFGEGVNVGEHRVDSGQRGALRGD